jgi:hypothetical protein
MDDGLRILLAAAAAAPSKRRRHPPDTRGTPTLDGAVRHPLVGNGYAWHPFLPIYKSKPARRF